MTFRNKPGNKIKALLLGLLAMAPLSALSAETAATTEEVTLKFFNWPDYIAPEVLANFEKEHHIKVEVVAYESDELKDDLLLRTNGGEGMDLILSARHSMVGLIDRQWVLPLDANSLPNRHNLMTRFETDRNKVKDYAIPYMWGTMGIAWRKDKLTKPLTTWKEFFNPAPELKGHIMTMNDSKDAIGMALKAAGYSANDTNPEALAKAQALLKTQKPSVLKYGYPALDKTSEMLGAEVWVAMLYNGDAITLKNLNNNIEYKVPREGGNIWVDYLAVLSKSKHPKEALAFLNYLCDPTVAAKNAEALNFAPANETAESKLPIDFLKNRLIYPPKAALGHSEVYTDLTPEEQKLRTDLFLEISN